MAQICIWAKNNENEYDYIKNICKDIDEDLTDEDFIGSSFSGDINGKPNYSLYDNAVGNGFRPIIIYPFGNPDINLIHINNNYPDYYFIQPFYKDGDSVPRIKELIPDRASSMILVAGGEDGESGWETGKGLIFTESSFKYDSYVISDIVDNEDGTCRIKCEGIGNQWWSYFADAFAHKIPVYIKDVDGFDNNPDGVYYPVGESYYTDGTANWVDIIHELGSGTFNPDTDAKAGFNFLSGAAAVVGAKLNKIRRERECEYDEAIAVAKVTASNPERDDEHGYGSINVDEAIAYDEDIPIDEDQVVGEIGTLSYQRDNLGYVTFSMPEVRNAQVMRIYSGNEKKYEVDVGYGDSLRFTSAVPAGTYRAVAFTGGKDSDSSNEITINSMALTNRPEKSKYTIGDTVYALKGGIVELEINQVVVEVSDVYDDGVGTQLNTYGFTDQPYTLTESELFSSKNSLLASLKGEYINQTGDIVLGINSFDSNLSGILYEDYAGLLFDGMTFDNSDAVNGGAEIDFTGKVIDGSGFLGCTFPTNSDTVSELKSIVKSYDKLTTIWTDGRPILDWSGLVVNQKQYTQQAPFNCTATAGSNAVLAVTGGANFNVYDVGDYIKLGSEERIIASIADATHCTVTENWGSNHTNVPASFCIAEDLSSRDLSGLIVVGTDFTRCKMPTNADTKAEFKALVGRYSATSTIWVDGTPVGD